MKKLIFILLLIPALLKGQSKFKAQFEQADLSFNETTQQLYFNDAPIYTLPLPASASITITITDTTVAPLSDIRDTLCAAWLYPGNPADNAAKLAFLKQYLINKIVNDYVNAKAAQAAVNASSISNQVSVQ